MTVTDLHPVPAPRSTAARSTGTSPARRRRPRPRTPEAPAWSCENCTQPNAGRRRRCADCGTSRF